jgi:Fe-S cluster assembly ATPase SufC
MIQVSELHFSTEDGIKVLEDVHLHVDRGHAGERRA